MNYPATGVAQGPLEDAPRFREHKAGLMVSSCMRSVDEAILLLLGVWVCM